jgi:hypothetical protein
VTPAEKVVRALHPVVKSTGPWARYLAEHVELTFPIPIALEAFDFVDPTARNALGGRSGLTITLVVHDTYGDHEGALPQVTLVPLPPLPTGLTDDALRAFVRAELYVRVAEVLLHELAETLLIDGEHGDPHQWDEMDGTSAVFVPFDDK